VDQLPIIFKILILVARAGIERPGEVNPTDCTKDERVLDRIIAPKGEKGSCHEVPKVHSGF